MTFKEWLRIRKHMEVEDYLKLGFNAKLAIEYEWYNEGYC